MLPVSLSQSIEQSLTELLRLSDMHEASNMYYMVQREVECALFKVVLEHTNYNQSKAASMLGISRSTLRKKIQGTPLSNE